MLKEKRKEYQLTQEQLAEKIFVSNKTISNWETGKTKPDIESLILLAKFFHLSLDNLLLEGSEMVESLDKDIKKGRNLKKIVLIAVLPLLIIIGCFGWLMYRGNHRTLAPVDEVTNLTVTTENLTKETKIEGSIKLKPLESFVFMGQSVEDGTLYLMIYKEPRLFSHKSDFSFSLDEVFSSKLSIETIDKIVLTYWDTKEIDGYSSEQLIDEFPQKVIWERSFQ